VRRQSDNPSRVPLPLLTLSTGARVRRVRLFGRSRQVPYPTKPRITAAAQRSVRPRETCLWTPLSNHPRFPTETAVRVAYKASGGAQEVMHDRGSLKADIGFLKRA